eukprot:TRINITY_DN5_c0_g5_i1.p1 TRINITY_DN5_c0_g5~~TRINITY_DN5_c0_g5_i1.p1  ORF type:complete len:303 (+),score=82.10 TRINITY_DN5_c0_g5_i1:120-1028(+)
MTLFVAPLRVTAAAAKRRTLAARCACCRARISATCAAPKSTGARVSAALACAVVAALCTTRAHALSPPSASAPAVASARMEPVANSTRAERGAWRQLAVAVAGERQHSIGHSAASFLRARGMSSELAVLAISALPVVELRGGIPVGFVLGLPPARTLALSVAGNMLPVLPVLWLLRLSFVQRVGARWLTRARVKARSVANSAWQARALALFVGVPLPGTGAWTGCVVAFVLGMSHASAFVAVLVGVVSAALIVTALCLMGAVGGAIAAGVLLASGALWVRNSVRGDGGGGGGGASESGEDCA